MSYFKPFHTSIELLGKVFIKNLRAEATTTDPTTNIDQPGRIWYDKTLKTWKTTVLDTSGQTVIESAPTRAEITAIQNAVSTQATAITALQTADTTINQLGTTYLKLDGTNVMAGALDFGGFRATNIADGSASTDAISKAQLTSEISKATTGLVSTSAMQTAITNALGQHISGAFKFGGVVTTHINTSTGDLVTASTPFNISDSGWTPDATGNSAGYVFSVRAAAGHESTTIGWFSLDGTTANMVEAKVGDDLIIGADGKLYVDDNTNSQVSSASPHVIVTGSSTVGYTIDVSLAVKNAADHVLFADGSRAMYGGLDMGTHVISNLQSGATSTEAINKGQTDTALNTLAGKIADKIGTGLTQVFKNVTGGQGYVVAIDPVHNLATWDAAANDWIFNGLINIYVRQAGGTAWQQAEVYTELVTYGNQSGNAYGHVAQFKFVPEVGGDDFMVVIGSAKTITKSDFVVTV